MPAFHFKAVNAGGKVTSGMLEAASSAAARQSLRSQGLLPLEVANAAPEKAVPRPTGQVFAILRGARAVRIPPAALALITRQMATLLAAGLRVEDALSAIALGQSPRIAGILLTVRGTVLEGRSFAVALADYPQVFSELYRASVRAGEQSGQLDQVMSHLASFVENRARNRQTVQLALLYPMLLAFASLTIIAMLMVFVIPDIMRVFSARGADLPVLTRALIAGSDLVRDYGAIALGVTVLGIVGFRRWLATGQNRLQWHRMLATWRPTARAVRRMNSAQFTGTLATLVQSRVPLIEALQAASEIMPNLFVRARVVDATEKVRRGNSLKRAMEEAGVFPAMLIAMVASGEAGGHLGDALVRAAADQQGDLDAWVRALVALVEPAILLVMGGVVMVMVLAILLPIVSMNNLAGM
ncbi:type II secretion system F family protein [Paracoccus sp. SY]|uniref:type II secretion system F family protein n=1 Tax=Paracoccus sp. SY TaxID=1330255 RepID=UPI000CD1F165|nr:type II secretion system F family protein [Paracoccus sp. SY]